MGVSIGLHVLISTDPPWGFTPMQQNRTISQTTKGKSLDVMGLRHTLISSVNIQCQYCVHSLHHCVEMVLEYLTVIYRH